MATIITDNQWRLLENWQPADTGAYAVGETGVQAATGEVLYGLDRNGHRHLLVPVPEKSRIREDRKSSGVQIFRHILTEGGRQQTYVDMACLKPWLNSLFGQLAGEVLELLEKPDTVPVDACARIIDRWRDLLNPAPSRLVSMNVLVGLYGELWYLREMVRIRPHCLDAWTGPDASRHDFSRILTALEIKTSTSLHQRIHEIHGPRQLEAIPGGLLYFAGLKVEQLRETGESVPDVIAQIITLGAPADELYQRLALTGYHAADADAYRQIRFSIVENRFYRVDETFPRIIPASFAGAQLPPGIVGLNYVIDLSNEPPRPMTDEEVAAVLAFLAGESLDHS